MGGATRQFRDKLNGQIVCSLLDPSATNPTAVYMSDHYVERCATALSQNCPLDSFHNTMFGIKRPLDTLFVPWALLWGSPRAQRVMPSKKTKVKKKDEKDKKEKGEQGAM